MSCRRWRATGWFGGLPHVFNNTDKATSSETVFRSNCALDVATSNSLECPRECRSDCADEVGFVNLEGYVRSPARAFDRHEGRPHISRIERSRGPVNRYGEGAGAVLVFEALSTLQGLAGGDHGAVRRRRRGFGRSLNAR